MPNFKLTIEVNDVARGDMRDLAEAILSDHGDDFDSSRGDFKIEVLESVGVGVWAPIDLEDED